MRAHFEMNFNHPELEQDRNENKHHNIAKRMVKRGGRRDIFLGTRECQAFVEPCVFGEGGSCYDTMPGEVGYGFMYHGITYAEEAIEKGRNYRIYQTGGLYGEKTYTSNGKKSIWKRSE